MLMDEMKKQSSGREAMVTGDGSGREWIFLRPAKICWWPAKLLFNLKVEISRDFFSRKDETKGSADAYKLLYCSATVCNYIINIIPNTILITSFLLNIVILLPIYFYSFRYTRCSTTYLRFT